MTGHCKAASKQGASPPALQAELNLLARAGYAVPPRARVAVDTWRGRLFGWVMARFDHPPVAVTVGRTVYITAPQVFWRHETAWRAALLAHEFTHVRQWQRMGRLRFALAYLREYLRVRCKGVDTHHPEEGISFEREAIQVEREIAARLAAVVSEAEQPVKG